MQFLDLNLDLIKRRLEEKGEIVIKVKVKPGKKQTFFMDYISELEAFVLSLGALPVDGKANKELIRFMSDFFVVKKTNIVITSGQGAKIKIIKITL